MPTRYIRENDFLYHAWIVERKYKRPTSTITAGIQPKPQFVIIDEKKHGLLEVIEYWHYEQLERNEDSYFPLRIQQMLLPISYLVKDGDPVPWEVARLGHPRTLEIDQELDILRGKILTPKGYTVDKARTKELMAELKQIKREMGYG